MILTFKYRIKDSTTKKHLIRYSYGVNQIWNYCCEVQLKSESNYKSGAPQKRWFGHFDFCKLTVGSCKDFGIHSDTVNIVCKQFSSSRDKARRAPRFRASRGPKRALGWVPFAGRATKIDGQIITYLGQRFRFWKTREIPLKIKTGAFVEDARGRWYLCLQCEVDTDLSTGREKIGIDLGIKTLATCSNGDIVAAMRHYRRYEAELAIQQRAGNKSRVRAIHAKIKNSRKDHLHKASLKIVRENSFIVVGDVSSSKLAKTRMAKSVFDAGWAEFKYMLRYKARRHGAEYLEVNERYTSQTCSDCGVIGGPKGIAGLGIRQWECSACGSNHDRDVNAAKNILAIGTKTRPPAEEISLPSQCEKCLSLTPRNRVYVTSN